MKRKSLLYSAALILLLLGISAISVSSVYAHPGHAPDPPPPWEPPTTPDPPEPPGDGDTGDTKRTTVLTQIFKIVFDSSIMKDAVVTALDDIFNDATRNLSMSDNPLFQMGSEISKIVFESANLKKIRRSSWLDLRKVAFALLPLTAALTIWASMKDGLYSVTGYANTFEAIAEFFVSIALALASFWLMEQAISLTKTLTLAIAESLQVEVTRSVYAGMLVRPMTFASSNPIMSMVLGILSFALVLTYMGSVTIAFLAREVVLIMTVALAPLMIILGSVRPLAWLRGLWAKAFLIFLLLLPINVLVMGIAYKLWLTAMDLAADSVVTILQLIILTGTMSVLIAVNGTLGKMVYGGAIEVAQKVGNAFTQVAAMGASVVGLAAAGGIGGAALAGSSEVLAPAAGGGSGAGLVLNSPSTGGVVTSTSNLTSKIGSILASSGNSVLSGFGKGTQVGAAVKDHKMSSAAPPTSPKLDIANNGVPGQEAGAADVMSQIDTPQKAVAIGSDQETLSKRAALGVNTSVAMLEGAENDGLSARDVLRKANYLGPGNWDEKSAGRNFIRSEAGTFAFRDKSPYRQTDIAFKAPSTNSLHELDFVAAQRIVQHEQNIIPDGPYNQISPVQIQDVARAVRTQRLSGKDNYPAIINEANSSATLRGWIERTQGNKS